jgi:hypothetical protein
MNGFHRIDSMIRRICSAHLACAFVAVRLCAQAPCQAEDPRATYTIHHVKGDPALSLDPTAKVWKHAAETEMVKDCSRQIDYPDAKSAIRGFWTDKDLYLLFRCPYQALNIIPTTPGKDHVGLWDHDVVEMFFGDDWNRIRHYREFEIAPTGDRIDLAIDLDQKTSDHDWDSGWQTMARIDEAKKIWYAAAKIPLSAVTASTVKDGTKWRANLYRIDGLGADPQRHFMCWQPTCVQNRDPNHVPEHFGTLIFSK